MSWITVDDVAAALGPTADTTDPYMADCAAAADAWAQRKRQEAGYRDDLPDVAPGPDVKMGTVQYAVALWRERGSTDSYASFDELGAGAGFPIGSMGQIKRLLGIGKGQVDTPLDFLVPVVNPLGTLRTRRPR